ncbi:uncharacterized protein V6R79_021874 [Siganus canaliculatus]
METSGSTAASGRRRKPELIRGKMAACAETDEFPDDALPLVKARRETSTASTASAADASREKEGQGLDLNTTSLLIPASLQPETHISRSSFSVQRLSLRSEVVQMSSSLLISTSVRTVTGEGLCRVQTVENLVQTVENLVPTVENLVQTVKNLVQTVENLVQTVENLVLEPEVFRRGVCFQQLVKLDLCCLSTSLHVCFSPDENTESFPVIIGHLVCSNDRLCLIMTSEPQSGASERTPGTGSGRPTGHSPELLMSFLQRFPVN